MVLIYFSRMKMKGERFFFFYLDNIDVYFPLILMQKLSVYIRDNSVNLYREETLKNILLIFHFPFETRTTLHMKYNMFLPKWKIQLITILVTSGITKKKKKKEQIQPISNYPRRETSVCELCFHRSSSVPPHSVCVFLRVCYHLFETFFCSFATKKENV